MQVTRPEGGKVIKAWVDGVPFEDAAREQVTNLAKMPFIHSHVAVMPDVHAGRGATVGSVIATRGAIIPAAVGVDIGCGMMAAQTTLKASDLPDNLGELRSAIESLVPHGGPGDVGSWDQGTVPLAVDQALKKTALFDRYQMLCAKHPEIRSPYVVRQMGTLGTGNHFVEICLDDGTCPRCTGHGGDPKEVLETPFGAVQPPCKECGGMGKVEQNVWVMLHSGSRGPGNRIGTYFIEKAKEEMRRWFINLPDQDLAYIPEDSQLFTDYWTALGWAQEFAMANRKAMFQHVQDAMVQVLGRNFSIVNEAVNCHHNYVDREAHFGANVLVTRKGAVRARKGDLGIIPGSMGARSYIVRGKGNPDSFNSCSHGAGRKMSRGEAKKTFTLADHEAATAGVECRKDADVIDETPGAYKDIDQVMAAQADLVEVVTTLKQILCVKG